MTATGLPGPSIGGGAFLASVVPPCFPGAVVVLAPVESLDEGGGLTVGALALEIFSGFRPSQYCSCAPGLLSQILLHLSIKQFSYSCLVVTPQFRHRAIPCHIIRAKDPLCHFFLIWRVWTSVWYSIPTFSSCCSSCSVD